MSLLRIIGAVLIFIFLGLVGFFTLVVKLLGTLFNPRKIIPPTPRSQAKDRNDRQKTDPSKKPASQEIIEVEVISIRQEDDKK